ncbi:MAG TPA: hypothetical protein PK400_10195 [Phycisphaerales bacterium]|nr:hypothetical protein [Phycisphaerales bacterium]
MANKDLLDGMAVFASSYVKRFLEGHYDVLMRTAPARKLMGASKPTRYGIEAALYALVAYADQHWSPRTPLRRLVREVALDTPAELSKRLVNGFREEVMATTGSGKSDTTRSLEQAMLQLDDATLGQLLRWLGESTPQDRERIRTLIPTLSDAELQNLARLAPDDLEVLMRFAEPPRSQAKKGPSRLSQAIKVELDEANRRVDEQLVARRRRKQ